MGRSTRALIFAMPIAFSTPAFGEPLVAQIATAVPSYPARREPTVQLLEPQLPPDVRLIEIRGRNRLVGSWMLSEEVMVGLGLYRIQRTGPNESNRSSRPRATLTETQRIAAVGVSLSF
jgi:hypothetical protein